MSLRRREFMKLFGVSVASLFLSRCRSPFAPQTSCYLVIVTPPGSTPMPRASSARKRLRLYWLSFSELARKSPEDTEDKFGNQLIAEHRAALDELVAGGELSTPVAALVQEAYEAAVYHVWRSNVPITCYEPAWVNYAPVSASVLVEQSQVLNQIAEQGIVDPDTLAKVQAALEHDLSFYALTDEEVQALYERVRTESQKTGEGIPPFEALEVELTPEAQDAAQFIVELLTSR